jgi:hypothetical protein
LTVCFSNRAALSADAMKKNPRDLRRTDSPARASVLVKAELRSSSFSSSSSAFVPDYENEDDDEDD